MWSRTSEERRADVLVRHEGGGQGTVEESTAGGKSVGCVDTASYRYIKGILCSECHAIRPSIVNLVAPIEKIHVVDPRYNSDV